MDGQRLDAVSRLLARGPSRRALLAGLGVVVVGTTVIPTPAVADEEAGWVAPEALGGGICRLPRFPCSNNGQCCAGGCLADGTCGCLKRGRTAWLKAVCCSGKKKRKDKGKCR